MIDLKLKLFFSLLISPFSENPPINMLKHLRRLKIPRNWKQNIYLYFFSVGCFAGFDFTFFSCLRRTNRSFKVQKQTNKFERKNGTAIKSELEVFKMNKLNVESQLMLDCRALWANRGLPTFWSLRFVCTATRWRKSYEQLSLTKIKYSSCDK